MVRSSANPDDLDRIAERIASVATRMQSVAPGLRPYLHAASGGCGDPGLADAIRGFEQRSSRAMEDQEQLTVELSKVLHQVAAAFRAAGG